ncbi:hypothetical protein BWQ96_07975 [Gracilariopsis chorda]|uniref:BTB domain-containing protein n=1 Tax=Gracilariopsis chorda TaxID=448386 RepID=A0A2V3IJI5_9FLOR|nr:hypothetical protein BWQ96_07975 [Gracilariopsis chorda]|eukprot:PXF42256.1 hypothetical protein BWQ96_07975 [Gracilariopsis chorda]
MADDTFPHSHYYANCKCLRCLNHAEVVRNTYKTQNDVLRRNTLSLLLGPNAHLYCDTTLVSSDGLRFPVCKSLLALQSTFFQRLFFSQFKESSADEIRVSVKGAVIREVLEFVYLGECQLVERVLRALRDDQDTLDLRELVELDAAANYFILKALESLCDNLLFDLCAWMYINIHRFTKRAHGVLS